MDNYYYHGIEGYDGVSAQICVKILKEGILMRNIVRNYNDNRFNHVCLYKKNNKYDYDSPDFLIDSARGGFIDHCFVFVINPQIKARKATRKETDLVDEWRCYSNISPSDIVGIALPFESIIDYLNSDFDDEETIKDKELLKESLTTIEKITEQLNIPIYNSDKENFTDEIDSELQNNKTL